MRSTSPSNKGKAPATAIDGPNATPEKDTRPKVISPELRKLLSRKVEVLPRNVVQKKGMGRDEKKVKP